MYKDNLRLAVVNFCSKWGDKQANINKMEKFIDDAYEQGVKMIIFPEASLLGYDNVEETPYPEKMQMQFAETIPGQTTNLFSSLAKEKDMYIIFGMPQKDDNDENLLYNSAVVCAPDGRILSYQKIHLPVNEGDWAVPGSSPMTFETEYGPVGLSICYDMFCFPELIRISKAKGARLYVSPVACSEFIHENVPLQMQLEHNCLTNYIYMASANLCGPCKLFNFVGGSSIIGLSDDSLKKAKYYAGHPYGHPEADKEGMFVSDIDLSLMESRAILDTFRTNSYTGHPDFRPEVYAKAYQEIFDSKAWQEKIK